MKSLSRMAMSLIACASWALVLAPQVALACPQCAGRDGGGIGRLLLLGAMILSPFAVVGVAVRAIRRAESPSE